LVTDFDVGLICGQLQKQALMRLRNHAAAQRRFKSCRGRCRHGLRGVRPIDILRWTAGITLMWASVEKWAYTNGIRE
jgi:hypothetical protein